jgi:TolB-like protein/Tfp pilus assembly protein PilF
MPFVNTSGNQDVEYLADGITETLISKLSQLPNMNVKARSSVFHYKGKETDAKTIGSELNVQAVLNGRVLQRGDELTLTVELVDTHSENVIWSEQYSRRQDLINLQSEIARDVVSKLRSKLSGAEEQKLAKAYTTDPEAYQLYLKGIFYRSKRSPDDLRKGLDYFQQAVARDPNYALAYVGIANSNSLFAVFGLIPTSEGYPRAKAAAQKAMEIDNTLSEAHATLADVAANYDWDWELAEREYKRALELDPNDAGAHASYGLHYLIPMRRFDEAVQELRRALELEPLSLSINASFGAALTSARRYDEAITQLRKTVELDPNFVLTRWRLTFAYSCAGRHAEAIAEAKKGLEISNAPWSKSMLAGAYARAGDREGALKMIEELKQVKPPNNTAFMIGRAYAELGDKEQAFEWLNKAYANKDWMLPKIHVEPWIDGKLWKENISPDPRMADLVRRMGLTP